MSFRWEITTSKHCVNIMKWCGSRRLKRHLERLLWLFECTETKQLSMHVESFIVCVNNIDCYRWMYDYLLQSNLSMRSPLLSSHLYQKLTFFLFCYRQFQMTLTSLKRSPILKDRSLVWPKGDLVKQAWKCRMNSFKNKRSPIYMKKNRLASFIKNDKYKN